MSNVNRPYKHYASLTTMICNLVGCWLLTDTWKQFFGLLFIVESVIFSLEMNWPSDAIPPWMRKMRGER